MKATHHTTIRKHGRAARRLLAVSALSVGLAQGLMASGEPQPAAVGEVSFVLGKAFILRGGERREQIRVGTQVAVSDRIETEPNGHVHIRFVDNELVSVRPYSALEVERYDYRPEAPEQSAIKFNLIEGVTRAISGKAAKAARGNFRMNTPIAAIGVRGTDFVVRATDDAVRAQVNEGAIVVAPFSTECMVDALGPCSQNALELAGGASQILQITANNVNPVLLPTQGGSLPQAPALAVDVAQTPPASSTSERDESSKDGLYTASTVTSRAVNEKIALTRAVGPNPPQTGGPDTPALPEFTPDIAMVEQQLAASQLMWGRYSDARVQNERISTLVQADQSNVSGREITVGNYSYGLFRTEFGSKAVKPGLGVVGFDLLQAQAVFTGRDGAQLMDVNGGMLSLDFQRSTYATTLNLSHAATGSLLFSNSGTISRDGGYFHDMGGDSDSLAGAVSLDGAEAGYFFEKILEIGTIEGLTLWGRQP